MFGAHEYGKSAVVQSAARPGPRLCAEKAGTVGLPAFYVKRLGRCHSGHESFVIGMPGMDKPFPPVGVRLRRMHR